MLPSKSNYKLEEAQVSCRAWEAICPPFKILLLEGFHIVFWISSCVNFASHEHYYWVRSSESPRLWDQVSLQDLASVSPSSNERVTSFNCGMKQSWTWFSDPVLVTPDLLEFCWSANLAKARMWALNITLRYYNCHMVVVAISRGSVKWGRVGWVDYVSQSPLEWGQMTIICHHTAAGFFSCSLRGVFAGYWVMTAPIHWILVSTLLSCFVLVSVYCYRIQAREGVSIEV